MRKIPMRRMENLLLAAAKADFWMFSAELAEKSAKNEKKSARATFWIFLIGVV